MKFITAKKILQKKGFAMLFAVLASSLLIAIGVSIFNISLKELQIATSEQASQAAYYAADSAEECALYWDIKMGAFPTCLNNSCNPATPGDVSTSTSNTIVCNGNSTVLNFTGGASNNYTYTYKTPAKALFFNYGSSIINPQAIISISKQYIPANTIIQTVISAQGLNSGVVGRRVERGITEVHNQ